MGRTQRPGGRFLRGGTRSRFGGVDRSRAAGRHRCRFGGGLLRRAGPSVTVEYRIRVRHQPRRTASLPDWLRRGMASATSMCRGRIDPRQLRAVLVPNALVLADVEGYETILLEPSRVPDLCRAAIIVEFHEWIVPGATTLVLDRFTASHHVKMIDSRPRDAFRPWPPDAPHGRGGLLCGSGTPLFAAMGCDAASAQPIVNSAAVSARTVADPTSCPEVAVARRAQERPLVAAGQRQPRKASLTQIHGIPSYGQAELQPR